MKKNNGNAAATTRPLCRLLRRTEITALTGLARTTIYDMVRRGDFPPPLRLSRNYAAWREDDVQDWLNSRPVTLGPTATPTAAEVAA